MSFKHIANGGLGAKPPEAGDTFRTCLEPFERTRFLTFKSQLKKLNSLTILLLTL